MFVNDHLQNFAYNNLPAFCIGLAGSYEAPSEGGAAFMRIPARTLRGNPEWAMSLLEAGLAAGIDFAYSHDIESWDELSVPLHFLMPGGEVPLVTVYTNCAAPPLPTPRRCQQVGAFVGDFIRARPSGERVALVATGGISHWVGTPETGRINPEFDLRVLDKVARGDIEPLTRLTGRRSSGRAATGARRYGTGSPSLAPCRDGRVTCSPTRADRKSTRLN